MAKGIPVLRQLHWWDYKPWSCASYRKRKALGIANPALAWHDLLPETNSQFAPQKYLRAPSWGQGSSSFPTIFKGELGDMNRTFWRHLWNIPSSICIVIGRGHGLTKYQSKKSQIPSEMCCDRHLEAEPKKNDKNAVKAPQSCRPFKSLREWCQHQRLVRFSWFDWPRLPQSFQYYQWALKITTPQKRSWWCSLTCARSSVPVCLKTDKHPRRWLGRWLWFWLCLFRPLERHVSWKISSKRNQKPTLLEVFL